MINRLATIQTHRPAFTESGQVLLCNHFPIGMFFFTLGPLQTSYIPEIRRFQGLRVSTMFDPIAMLAHFVPMPICPNFPRGTPESVVAFASRLLLDCTAWFDTQRCTIMACTVSRRLLNRERPFFAARWDSGGIASAVPIYVSAYIPVIYDSQESKNPGNKTACVLLAFEVAYEGGVSCCYALGP